MTDRTRFTMQKNYRIRAVFVAGGVSARQDALPPGRGATRFDEQAPRRIDER